MKEKLKWLLPVIIPAWIVSVFSFVAIAHFAPCGELGCGQGAFEVFSVLFAIAFFIGIPLAVIIWLTQKDSL